MTAERKAEQTAWLADAGTVGDVECRECGKRASNYRHYAHPSGHDCLSGCPEGLHHTFYPLPTESEPEREMCPQFYCPNHPAWIPVGQNGCPHCSGTATRGFCICETASVDEIRDMYTPPAPETPSPDVGMSRDEHEACREIERAVTWYEARSGRRVRNIGISRNDDGSVTAFWSLAAAKETK